MKIGKFEENSYSNEISQSYPKSHKNRKLKHVFGFQLLKISNEIMDRFKMQNLDF